MAKKIIQKGKTKPAKRYPIPKALTKNKGEIVPVKIRTLDEAKRIAIRSYMAVFEPNAALKELAEKQLPGMRNGQEITGEVLKNADKVSLAFSLESGHALVESIEPKYRSFALQFKKDLEKEFDCKTASERALVDQAVNSHIRKISYSKSMMMRRDPGFLSHYKTGYLMFLSKEVDRAHRQFISAIETLKYCKQPTVRINVRSENSFMSQNQQFNINPDKQ
ncbi:MAG: hypothetical protein NT170_03680 [Candidatus Moranbacteria bacterium]|nr:hypothetical protein [Candidatus Moranbacteria bacterium]